MSKRKQRQNHPTDTRAEKSHFLQPELLKLLKAVHNNATDSCSWQKSEGEGEPRQARQLVEVVKHLRKWAFPFSPHLWRNGPHFTHSPITFTSKGRGAELREWSFTFSSTSLLPSHFLSYFPPASKRIWRILLQSSEIVSKASVQKFAPSHF